MPPTRTKVAIALVIVFISLNALFHNISRAKLMANGPDFVFNRPEAIVTTLIEDTPDYVNAVSLLAHQLHEFDASSAAIVVIVPKDTSAATRSCLSKLRLHVVDEIYDITRQYSHFFLEKSHVPATSTCYENDIKRLYAWTLTGFNRVLFVDAHVALTTNPTELLNILGNSQVEIVAPKESGTYFSSSIMAFRPSAHTFSRMLDSIPVIMTNTTQKTVQVFLNNFYPDWWRAGNIARLTQANPLLRGGHAVTRGGSCFAPGEDLSERNAAKDTWLKKLPRNAPTLPTIKIDFVRTPQSLADNQAFVVYIGEDSVSYARSARVIAHSILSHSGGHRNLVAMITPNIGPALRSSLSMFGYTIIDVPAVKCGIQLKNSDLGAIHAWALPFEKIVYLDVKTFPLDNVNDLFYLTTNSPLGAAVNSFGGIMPDVLVIQPNNATFNQMKKLIKSDQSKCSLGEVLNHLNKPRDLALDDVLDAKYNFPHTETVANKLEPDDYSVVRFDSLPGDNSDERRADRILKTWRAMDGEAREASIARMLDRRERILLEMQNNLFGLLSPFLTPGRKVAIVDWPDHKNCGDHAIYVGEEALITHFDVDIVFRCSAFFAGKYRYTGHDCNFEELRQAIGDDGIILSHGGGNVRNYPDKNITAFYQTFRLWLLEEFQNHEIVWLAQSVNFEAKYPAVLKYNAAKINAHKKLTILLRDQNSFDVCTTYFTNARCLLSPDMAFMMGLFNFDRGVVEKPDSIVRKRGVSSSPLIISSACNLHAISNPENETDIYDVVWVRRQDKETKFASQEVFNYAQTLRNVYVFDWKMLVQPLGTPPSEEMLARSCEILGRGMRMLRQGKVIYTDRLHGVILTLLLGRPIVCTDNNYGKITRLAETFLENTEQGRFQIGLYEFLDERKGLDTALQLAKLF